MRLVLILISLSMDDIQVGCKVAPYFSIRISIIYSVPTKFKNNTLIKEVIPFLNKKSNL